MNDHVLEPAAQQIADAGIVKPFGPPGLLLPTVLATKLLHASRTGWSSCASS